MPQPLMPPPMIKISKLLFFISYNLLAKEMFSAPKAILGQINVVAPFRGSQ